MKKRTIIDVENTTDGVQCDNCDYKEEYEVDFSASYQKGLKKYLNKPCPKCGANLLTKKDYTDAVQLMKTITWLNKWFGWLSIFSRKSQISNVDAHVHEGIHITDSK